MATSLQDDRPVVLHQGIYKKTATTAEAVFVITGMTIGAGILGIPYVVAKSGLLVGLIDIIGLGLVILFLNLMIGEVAARAETNLQLPGLAGKYLGSWAKHFLSLTIIFSGLGTLLAYLIGEGNTLASLFGGSAFAWSVIFWSVGSFLIWGGLQRIKKIDKILSFTVIGLIVAVSLYLLPYFRWPQDPPISIASSLFPLGVILFALHASPAVAEAHALLAADSRRFRKALIIGTLIPMAVYVLFVLVVVGAQGSLVTEVATIGLGKQFGVSVTIAANLFAVLAMSTAFMGLGTALKETLVWDHHFHPWLAKFLVVSIPLALFLSGLHSFVTILSVVGGVFIGLEAVIMALVYWRSSKDKNVSAPHFIIQRNGFVAVPLLLLFISVTVISFYTLFSRLF